MDRAPCHHGRVAVRVLALATLALPAARAEPAPCREGEDESPRAAAEGAVDAALDGLRAGTVDVAGATERICEIGGGAVPPVFARLAARAEAWLAGEAPATDDAGRALAAAVGCLPADAWRSLLAPTSPELGSPARRRLALSILGAIGSAPDVERALAIAAGSAASDGTISLRDDLAGSLGSILARDDAALLAATEAFAAADDAGRVAVVEAVESVEPKRALEALAGLLGREPALDAHLLDAIARVARGAPWVRSERACSGARERLGRSGPAVAHAAVRAVEAMRDQDSVGALVELLETAAAEGADAGETALAAHRALVRLARRPFPPEPARWRRWLADESRFWDERAPQLVADLRSREPAHVLAAMRELATHRRFAREVAREIAGLGSRPEPEIALLACRTLAHLESESGLPGLVDALHHADERVRAVALDGLRRSTGLDLGTDAGAWAERLDL